MISPQEKALEIFNKMCSSVDELLPLDVRECALIAVDEILNIIPCYEEYGSNGWVLIDNSEYWEEVKK
mgnify:FL=1